MKTMLKERRKILERLKRSKQGKKKVTFTITPSNLSFGSKAKTERGLKMKCGACGQSGHKKSNKACPMYVRIKPVIPFGNVLLNDPVPGTSEETPRSEYPAGFDYDHWKRSLQSLKTESKAVHKDDHQVVDNQWEYPAGFNFKLWNSSVVKQEMEDFDKQQKKKKAHDLFKQKDKLIVQHRQHSEGLQNASEDKNAGVTSQKDTVEIEGLLMDFGVESFTPLQFEDVCDFDHFFGNSEHEENSDSTFFSIENGF